MKIIVTIACLLNVLCWNAFATKGSHGGDGIKINNKLYLLDLFEEGVEKNPYYNSKIKAREDFLNSLKKKFEFEFEFVPIDKVAAKLSEIYSVYPLLAIASMSAIESYDWSWVNHSLIDVKDEHSSIDISSGELQQIAIRRDYTISISRKSWIELVNDDHRAALIIHEALYSIGKFKHYAGVSFNGDFLSESYQSSPSIRKFLGFLYKTKYHFRNKKILSNLASKAFNRGLLKFSKGDIFNVLGDGAIWEKNLYFNADFIKAIKMNRGFYGSYYPKGGISEGYRKYYGVKSIDSFCTEIYKDDLEGDEDYRITVSTNYTDRIRFRSTPFKTKDSIYVRSSNYELTLEEYLYSGYSLVKPISPVNFVETGTKYSKDKAFPFPKNKENCKKEIINNFEMMETELIKGFKLERF